MPTIKRRHLLAASAALGTGIALARSDRAAADHTNLSDEYVAEAAAAVDWEWHQMGEPEGRGWTSPTATRLTDRLPAHAEALVPATVWQRSRMSSSLYYRIRTDADAIAAQWTLPDELVSATYLTQASANGMDLYATDPTGQLRWASWGVPSRGGRVTSTLISGMVPAGGMREFRIYLPLYNLTDDIRFGVPAGSRFEVVPADPTPPVVHYGTSIVQGAGASRPGMSLPARLGRQLDHPVVGLGFSGVGRMEVELAGLLGELDAAVYVIDCVPNMTVDQVRERTVPFVRRLRQDRPTTPILLVEERTRTNAWIRAGWQDDIDDRRAALGVAYRQLRAEGDRNLHLQHHDDMFGTDSEGAVDGSHPTDLGVTRMLDVIEPTVRRLLNAGPAGSR